MAGKLFLIDGHALIFKMYYAFLRRPMVNSKRVDTSILFGFTKYLLEMVEKEHPTHLAVAFDPPGGTFRNEMYPAYKANRPPTPQLVIDALEPLTEICRAMNIPVLMLKGFEADDVIGSMAKRCAREGFTVYMVTPDKDYGQLVEENIFQYKPGKGGDEPEILGVDGICAKYGIADPLQVIDMLAICGDSADNVPGVTGIGEVGAGKLISAYGSVENIYAHLGELTPRQQEMFRAAEDHIALSKTLVTIKTDIALETTSAGMVYDNAFQSRITELFDLYEFNSLKRYIHHVKPSDNAPAVSPRQTPLAPVEIGADKLMAISAAAGRVSVHADRDRDVWYLAVKDADAVAFAKGKAEDFRSILEDASAVKCGHGIKSWAGMLADEGIDLKGTLLDVELMHYLLNPERPHDLPSLASQYLGVDLAEGGREVRILSLFDDDCEEEEPSVDDGLKAAVIWPLAEKLEAQVNSDKALRTLYFEIEEPLSGVLLRMERSGVKVDVKSLASFAGELRTQIALKEALVREIAGEPELNVSSPKQLGEVIFEKLKLDPKAKKPSKGSWSTDEETLSALRETSPIIDAILDFRAAKKLLSTYIEPFPSYISPRDGRVHTTFNQALTSTGRLSSSNPNLQNIPIRTDLGKTIREAFVPEDPVNQVIMSADYSQIELRIMAHLCGDEHLTAAFLAGEDVHAATASKIFGVPAGEVTPDQRRIAKTANFGIMYGISAFGLSQRLKIPRSEAKKVIDDYFASFPSIRAFIDRTLENARREGYVETLFGRRRYVPDLLSHNANLRSLAERNAVNAPIQGTSADIIKLAMISVDRRLRREGLRSRMVLQIHDELLFEVPLDEIQVMDALVREEMENVIRLAVPLTVECQYGRNWLEAH